MDLITAKNLYITRSQKINEVHEDLMTEAVGLMETLTGKRLAIFRANLKQYYAWLREYDEVLSEALSLSGTYNELQMRAANIQIMVKARQLFVSSLESYEKALVSLEGARNFRLSLSIALAAVVFSAIGAMV